jgi:hypothetical protein
MFKRHTQKSSHEDSGDELPGLPRPLLGNAQFSPRWNVAVGLSNGIRIHDDCHAMSGGSGNDISKPWQRSRGKSRQS